MRVLLWPFIDLLARAGGYLGSVLKPRHRLAIERRLRGALLRPFFGASGLTVGRVIFESFVGVSLGEKTKLYCGTVIVPGANGHVRIGPESHLGYSCVLAGDGGISIGAGCAVSAHVAIYSVTNVPSRSYPIIDSRARGQVTIGDNVLIGMGVSILPGVTIGDGAVVAAGAVVVADVPAGLTVGGVPARPL